jgi:hypothetical protein
MFPALCAMLGMMRVCSRYILVMLLQQQILEQHDQIEICLQHAASSGKSNLAHVKLELFRKISR